MAIVTSYPASSRLLLQKAMPIPQLGQYWVELNPLALLRVTSVDLATSTLKCVTMERWASDGYSNEYTMFLPLSPENWVYLHFFEVLELDGINVGDIFIHPDNTLAFAARTPEGRVALYSDAPITWGFSEYQLFQRGPSPEGMNVWDHMEVV